jgi:hypothetical protein
MEERRWRDKSIRRSGQTKATKTPVLLSSMEVSESVNQSLRLIAVLGATLLASACSANSGSVPTPAADQSSGSTQFQPNVNQRASTALKGLQPETRVQKHATSNYVYVLDQKLSELLVYPANVQNPSPIRAVSISTPTLYGVTTDQQGNVYVPENAENTVQIFSSGGVCPCSTITNGMDLPRGVTVDNNDNLYVADNGSSPHVAEYAHNGTSPFATFPAPDNYATTGVATDSSNNLYVVLIVSGIPHGTVAECPAAGMGHTCSIISSITLAEYTGLAFDSGGDLAAASAATLSYYAPPSWNLVNYTYYGVGAAIGFLSAGPDESLYVPLENGSVVVIPSTGAQQPYSITSGLEEPIAAAAGI